MPYRGPVAATVQVRMRLFVIDFGLEVGRCNLFSSVFLKRTHARLVWIQPLLQFIEMKHINQSINHITVMYRTFWAASAPPALTSGRARWMI